MKSNRLPTLFFVISLLCMSKQASAQSGSGNIRLELDPKASAERITCNPGLSDGSTDTFAETCFSLTVQNTIVCKSPGSSRAYSQKINERIENANFDLELTTLSIPEGSEGKSKVKRYNYYKDRKSGQFVYIEEFFITSSGMSERRIYLNPSAVQDPETQSKLAVELGTQWEGGTNPAQAYQEVLAKTAEIQLPNPTSNSAKLSSCDFFASALDSEASALALGLSAGDFGESSFMGGNESESDDSREGNPKGNENADGGGLSIAEKDSFYETCMSARFVRNGEMKQISCNLGLPQEIVTTIDQANELTQPGILHLLTSEALQSFIMGHAALNGKTFKKQDLELLMKNNPACEPFKSIFQSVADDKSTLKKLEDEYDKRYTKGSQYLKELRKEALVRVGSLKNIEISALSMAELLKSRSECKSAHSLKSIRTSVESTGRRGGDMDMTDNGPSEIESKLFANNQCDKITEMEKQIQLREGMFPLLANDYDAEFNDTLWASAYDIEKGREYLKELAAIGENEDEKLLHFAKLRLGKVKLKTQELIADTCSAADMECTDQNKMCWHTLLEMNGLVKEVAKSTSPSLDPMFECLELVKGNDEAITNAASTGAGLACGVLGVAAGLASGGVGLPATLTAASVICGFGVYELMDRPMQSVALTDLELTRACFEVGTYCSQEQVEKSVNDAWWAIFGTKASLVGEAVGLAGEFSAVYKFLKNMPFDDRVLLQAYLKGSGKGKSQLQAARSANQLLQSLVSEGGSLDAYRMFMANEVLLTKIDPRRFLALREGPERLRYLRTILGPELSDDALSSLSKQLSEVKDLDGVHGLYQLAKNPSATPDDISTFIKSAPDDKAYAERVASLSLLAMDESNVAAKRSLDKLIHDPELVARLERGADELGCGG